MRNILKDNTVMELCVTGVHTLLTFVSLLSSLYSVSSVFPKSEFLIMPNMSPGHLSSRRSFGLLFVLPFVPFFFGKQPSPSAVDLNFWGEKKTKKQEITF